MASSSPPVKQPKKKRKVNMAGHGVPIQSPTSLSSKKKNKSAKKNKKSSNSSNGSGGIRSEDIASLMGMGFDQGTSELALLFVPMNEVQAAAEWACRTSQAQVTAIKQRVQKLCDLGFSAAQAVASIKALTVSASFQQLTDWILADNDSIFAASKLHGTSSSKEAKHQQQTPTKKKDKSAEDVMTEAAATRQTLQTEAKQVLADGEFQSLKQYRRIVECLTRDVLLKLDAVQLPSTQQDPTRRTALRNTRKPLIVAADSLIDKLQQLSKTSPPPSSL
jgi:hypothetical protein